MIETGVYPDVAAEEEPDPIGDYNIPDEIEEMGGVPRGRSVRPTMTMFWVLWLMKQVKRRRTCPPASGIY